MRACTVASNFDYPIIRIDTNQGVYGLGEVRDGGVKGQALVLKPHLVGQNPLNLDGILGPIKHYAGHGRLGGGYSAIDMALHDIAGKVYGVPAYRLVGASSGPRPRLLRYHPFQGPRSSPGGCSTARSETSPSSNGPRHPLVADIPGAVIPVEWQRRKA
jgi:L-alanine-DL-glutamate epimerase-like enolase superfamily enzyme